MGPLEHVLLRRVLGGMIPESLVSEPDCFGDRIGRDIAAPLLHNCFPSDSRSHLLHDIGHQDPGASKCRLTMADGGVGDNVSADHTLRQLMFLALRQGEYLWHNYSQLSLAEAIDDFHFLDSSQSQRICSIHSAQWRLS